MKNELLPEIVRDPYLQELLHLKDETIKMQSKTLNMLHDLLEEMNVRICVRLDELSKKEFPLPEAPNPLGKIRVL